MNDTDLGLGNFIVIYDHYDYVSESVARKGMVIDDGQWGNKG